MKTKYKEAKSVMLYDSNILINVDGFEHPFHLFPDNFNSLKIDTESLSNFIEHLGADISCKKNIQDFDLLYRETPTYLFDTYGSAVVTKLLSKIENGILDVQIFEKWTQEETGDQKDCINIFSYSGKFSVFWK